MENSTGSIFSFFKSIDSRQMSFDAPILMATAGLVLLLVCLWVFRSTRKINETRQRLNHLNKALSEDGSYGRGSLLTPWGKEPQSTGNTKSSGNPAPLFPQPVLNWSPPAEIKEPLVLSLESLEEDEPTLPKEKK